MNLTDSTRLVGNTVIRITAKDQLKAQARAELKAMGIGSAQLLGIANWIVSYTGPIIYEEAQHLLLEDRLNNRDIVRRINDR